MNKRCYVLVSLVAASIVACNAESNRMSDGAIVIAEGNLGNLPESAYPENDLDLEDDLLGFTAVTEAEFDATINRISFLFTPLFYFHGGELVITGDWSSPVVNAYASRSGDEWRVMMHGGLARRPEITPDGFALVACHEIAHHLGGYPFYSGALEWGAAEGQSDWYAAQACGRWLWIDEVDENAEFRATVDPVLRDGCDGAWADVDDQNLCYRIGMAGKSHADLSAYLEGTTISFSTPDPNEVTTTLISHPHAQCRLDTVVAAACCTVEPDFDVIPGLNVDIGRNSVVAEIQSAAVSCHPASEWMGTPGYNHSDHPRCWFKNQLDGAGFFLE